MSAVSADSSNFTDDESDVGIIDSSLSAADKQKKDLWRPSPSPKEDFGNAEGANSDGEWEYKIVGEEVDHKGDIKYEVRWENWQRRDGTKTTWAGRGSRDIDTITWDRLRKKERQILARESLEIEVVTTTDIHNTATYLRSQAYDEKLKICDREKQPNQVHEMARLMAKHQSHIHSTSGHISHPGFQSNGSSSSSTQLRSSQRTSTRHQTSNSFTTPSSSSNPLRGSSKPSTKSSIMSAEPSLPSSRSSSQVQLRGESSPKPTLSSKAKGKQRAFHFESQSTDLPSRESGSSRKHRRVVRSESTDPLSMLPQSSSRSSCSGRVTEAPNLSRIKLQQQWSLYAKNADAALIVFVNDVDDEEIPPISSSFIYLESTYRFSPDVDRPPSKGFLMTCECDACVEADICGCQGASELVDPHTGSNIFAYTTSGLFSFNVLKGIEVIECNKLCKCTPSSCLNRVSQRPRDIPVEIFKTEKRGWGARSSKAVKRGKVLGIYTGLVIHRDSYISLPEEQSEYCFDLDGDEYAGNEHHLLHKKYTVDSMYQGNWTRFINHSCTPNLQIYLVVHDLPPGTGMPYIAFVATQNIPARTEFTFDYDPKAGEHAAMAMSKGKRKGKHHSSIIPSGGKVCLCGSPECRGYMP